MDVIFSQFSSHLLSLLGVSPLPIGVSASTSHDSLLSEWRLDALARRRTLENAQGSQDTLLSIVKLVDQIENMPVGDDVKDDVEQALTALASVRVHETFPLCLSNDVLRCMTLRRHSHCIKSSHILPGLLDLPRALSLTLGCWLCCTSLLNISTLFILLCSLALSFPCLLLR